MYFVLTIIDGFVIISGNIGYHYVPIGHYYAAFY